MQDNLINKFGVVLNPGNIPVNFYIKKSKQGNYSLTNGFFETLISNEPDFKQITEKIKNILIKYTKKGFVIDQKFKMLNNKGLEKLFRIKFNINTKLEEIMKYSGEKYDYYIMDVPRIIDGERKVDRNIIFFTKGLNEYVGRFILNKVDSYSLSIGSIYITSSKQRLGHFTNVLKYDIRQMLEFDVDELYAFNILKKGLGFYEKLEQEGKFIFTDKSKINGKFLIKNF